MGWESHFYYWSWLCETKGKVTGHLHKEISKICCLFIHHGGTIVGIVKDKRRRSSNPHGGMVS